MRPPPPRPSSACTPSAIAPAGSCSIPRSGAFTPGGARAACRNVGYPAASRSRYRTDACRLALALGLYQHQEGKTAARLEDLVPKYLPEVPVDPYSGEAFCYRVSQGVRFGIVGGEREAIVGLVRVGQGLV